jgi:ribosomal protein L32
MTMSKKYRIVFHGLVGEEGAFREQMSRLGVPPDALDRMLANAPVIMKGELTLAGARRYADAVQQAGGKIRIEECGTFDDSRRINRSVHIASFKAFTMCPECGFKQQKGEVCVKCGFHFAREGEG